MTSLIIGENYANLTDTAARFRKDYIQTSPFPNIVFEKNFESVFLKSVLA